MSEVPLGAFLSGGIDSSAMVAVMAQESGNRVKTFSIGYEGAGAFQDERAYARIVAERYGTEHREFVVSPDVGDLLPDLVATMEQPFADSSVMPNYYISKLTRQHVTVALSGLGGDEIGGGYQRYLGMLWAERYARAPRAAPAPLAGGGGGPAARRALRATLDRPGQALLRDDRPGRGRPVRGDGDDLLRRPTVAGSWRRTSAAGPGADDAESLVTRVFGSGARRRRPARRRCWPTSARTCRATC